MTFSSDQFWNVPVDVTDHLSDFNFDGAQRDDIYNITVNYPGSTPSFVGILSTVTWPCLYIGNSQAGPLGEDVIHAFCTHAYKGWGSSVRE